MATLNLTGKAGNVAGAEPLRVFQALHFGKDVIVRAVMRWFLPVIAFSASLAAASAADLRVVGGLINPESAIVGADGRIYVSEIGEFGKDGDGRISAIGKSGQVKIFTTGLNDPKGLARWKHDLFVADKAGIWKIDSQGRATIFVKPEDFPQPPLFLNDLTFDSRGNLYVSDSGDVQNGGKGAIFKISTKGKVSVLINEAKDSRIKSPNGLLFERPGKLLVLDFATGELHRLDVSKLILEKIAAGFGGGDGLARDVGGTLYISDWKAGRVWKLQMKRQDAVPVQYSQTFQSAADIGLTRNGKYLLVPDMKAGTLTWLPK